MKRPDADGGTAPDRQSPPPPVDRAWSLVFGAWMVASSATLGALFFGEVMRLPPCTLCWYQRICMFPLAVILPFGLFPFNRGVVRAAIPLAAIGTAVAAFHVLLVAGVIPEQIKPCTQGVPCSETVIEWFGFVTIPLLALLAFVAVLVALIVASRRSTP
jgi:disulfide bond formation protein DsbB